ncbi:hypothetical protein [Acidipila rosea]|uniref:PhiE125 gp8 family phage protein n=1 Tax=Acidipila rosea TaxID=768535 RepID=A0A4R1L4L3_9BACT|nr:hypothetical protein [Acidipila rosea]MBW4028141.1 hypothetical protein [Acidobacteriota bacterium]MBW4046130.1 hypothetical protein [Acidobacteriota bacterium]TCK71980.1 hypothetical protein C7378_2604 [Acidipila rosea]
MGYLDPTQYAAYGLSADTTDDWITVASALIDNYCQRSSLNPTQYTERLRLVEGSQTARLSYLPLLPIAPSALPLVSIQARYTKPRRGELIYPLQEEVLWAFSLPGSWTTVDVTTVDFVPETGELVFPLNIMGLPYNEVEVTYTAGLSVIPSGVLAACAMIVKNAQSTPGLNVKSSRLDTMQVQYFSNSLIDAGAATLLRPYVSRRLG